MYVRNFKLNGKMIFKIIFVILTILILIEPFLDTYFLYNCGIEILNKLQKSISMSD
mgnify:CR=1 FL=1